MYDNIKSLRLVKEGSQTIVTAMISSEGEVMEFRRSGRYSSMGSEQSSISEALGIQLHALIANFKIELFYGNIVCWLPLTADCRLPTGAGQFLLINLKPVGSGMAGDDCFFCSYCPSAVLLLLYTLIDIGNWGLFMRLLSFPSLPFNSPRRGSRGVLDERCAGRNASLQPLHKQDGHLRLWHRSANCKVSGTVRWA